MADHSLLDRIVTAAFAGGRWDHRVCSAPVARALEPVCRGYDPGVDEPSGQREWTESVREQRAADVEAERAAVARMTMSERLERGVALSRFAVRMCNAFRDQSVTR